MSAPIKPTDLVKLSLNSLDVNGTLVVHGYQDTLKLKTCMESTEDYHALENCLMELVLSGKIKQTILKDGDVGLVLAITRFDVPNPVSLARFRFCLVLFDKEICVLDEGCLKTLSSQEV